MAPAVKPHDNSGQVSFYRSLNAVVGETILILSIKVLSSKENKVIILFKAKTLTF